ncbi:unnamed protein product [Euphydryas editha]|uniref:C2H2-type domain-containing protein n=1 Tax=Euphydryas editha TaxID=104508 RepID=A0AAU9V3C4_EUPED|nr:unnamed protein product [Euphydryas editha]
MSGNKINTKKKDEKSKVNRISSQATDENEEPDFSLLRKPILTNITGFAQARKIFDQATEELKNLLTNECDLLYECKVCRNIFRSLANFISHKRVYCKEKYNTSIHGHFFKETSTIQEVLKIRKLEESYQESLKEINDLNRIDDEETDKRIPITKDITEVVEKIIKHKGVESEKIKELQLAFQKIPKSSVAVYQNIIEDDKSNDCMQVQVKELDNILSQENAILQSDGTFKVQSNNNESPNTDNVIQISDDEDIEDKDVLKCRICDLQFSTQKTLKFHMKYKHVESRLVYPCPDCLDIFSTSWSVYRHLFKVHRKTAAQIRRLRESIQAKAFRMNNPPAFYEKRKTIPKNVVPQKITEEERLEQENQAWLEQLDGEGDGRRCGGCGRNFERRAALAARAHTCARRHRRRIQIQIRRDYHKAQHNPYLPSPARPAPLAPLAPSADTTPAEDSATFVEESATVAEDFATVIEDSATIVENSATVVQDSATVVEDSKKEEKILGKIDKEVKDEDEGNELTDAVVTLIDEKKEPDIEDKEIEADDKIEDDIIVQNKLYFFDSRLRNKLPFAQQAEKSNLNAFKQKMQSDTDIDQMLCKKCDTKFNEFNELFNHMGAHYKWMRYACKLCNFKHFDFEKLPEHVRIVHKLKGDTDFYYSTVKAVDGTEASELAETSDEVNDANEISPDSRRPSRCSSDSSRLSDDSSSSSNRVEAGSRKRKASRYKNNLKKKKDAIVADDGDDLREDDIQKDVLFIENDSSSNSKIFEENSSDLDEADEKITRRHHVELSTTVASRRPVRNKTKRKNEDFEYDLSNLLKMEAQGYRDSQTISTKSTQNKKRMQQDIQNNYELINKDCSGALITLSRKSVENAQGHMKTLAIFNISKESRISTVFARPMTPKVTKVDKISPKKDEKESKDTCSPNKVIETSNLPNLNQVLTTNEAASTDSVNKEFSNTPELEISKDTPDKLVKVLQTDEKTIVSSNKEEVKELSLDAVKCMAAPSIETSKTNINVPVVPIKFRQRSLEVIKNPLIKKNITDFTKAGMKTKILVIKPINRNADGTQSINSSLKFQTIKLKDPNNSSLNEDKKDQVVVVQVPKVDCTVSRPISSNSVVSKIKPSSIDDTKNPVNEDENVPMDTTSSENDPIVLDDCVDDQVSSKQIKSVLTSDSSESIIKTSETVVNLDNPINIEG